jgi:hypothetical protein
LDIFQEFEITGSDLESFNHAKLAAMGVETSDTRTIILEAIVGLGIDVPTYPTILTRKLKRKPFFKEDDTIIVLPISPTDNEEKNSIVTHATKVKLSDSEYGPVVAHLVRFLELIKCHLAWQHERVKTVFSVLYISIHDQ